jgi:hypothetical protein
MTYNIPDHVSGDTWEGISSITLRNNNIPLNLEGADIIMQVRSNYNNTANPLYLELTTENEEISVPFPADGSLSINPLIVDLPVGIYDYSLQVKFSDGILKTYLQGKWKILPNTVRSKFSKRNMSDLNIYFGADTLTSIPNDPNEIIQLTPLKINSTIINDGYKFDVNVPENIRRVIIAYPDELKDITSILYKTFMDISVLDKFTKKTILLDRKTPYGIVKVLYKVYYYISSVPYASPATYSVNI